ncbi:hypothetical protein [Brucella ovis]|uniref:hypothetical protein n=1 Tax=Brucella ovis TaxID=236 RepID=UPI0003154241|nr:hypothetical protein [Brucella ovis]
MADCHNQGGKAVFLPHFDSKPYGRIAVGRPGLQMRFASGHISGRKKTLTIIFEPILTSI